jgi:hypothetical protein
MYVYLIVSNKIDYWIFQLCYLLGPGRQHIIEQDHSQILSCLPSGYCRLTNIEQGKTIEKQLYSILPERLNIELVKINDDDLALFICSSAGEKIFQQSKFLLISFIYRNFIQYIDQTHYAIISEPTNVRCKLTYFTFKKSTHGTTSVEIKETDPTHN